MFGYSYPTCGIDQEACMHVLTKSNGSFILVPLYGEI